MFNVCHYIVFNVRHQALSVTDMTPSAEKMIVIFVINISHCMVTTVTFCSKVWKMIISKNEITQMAYLRSTMKYYVELSIVKKQSCPNRHNETPCISVSSLVPVRWHLPWQHQCVSLTDSLLSAGCSLDNAPNCSGLKKNKPDNMCNCT